jgi:hypothetical protein
VVSTTLPYGRTLGFLDRFCVPNVQLLVVFTWNVVTESWTWMVVVAVEAVAVAVAVEPAQITGNSSGEGMLILL